MKILPLHKGHDREGFDCGNVDLNLWLQQVARQHQEKKVSKTYVAVESDASVEILGYYSVSLTELANDDVPESSRKKLPRRVPAFRLGRLAVSKTHRGKGYGELLLFDAISRVKEISAAAGGVWLVVDAKPDAIEFYKRYDFEQLRDHPQQLFLLL